MAIGQVVIDEAVGSLGKVSRNFVTTAVRAGYTKDFIAANGLLTALANLQDTDPIPGYEHITKADVVTANVITEQIAALYDQHKTILLQVAGEFVTE